MLDHGFDKVEVCDGYVVANDEFVYPFAWLENDYIFYRKICKIEGGV